MRIPIAAPFVLFQFAEGNKGRVMFTAAGTTKQAREHFSDLVQKLHNPVIAGTPGLTSYVGIPDPVIIKKTHSCLIYRKHGVPMHHNWPNISEEHLHELCKAFGDWVVEGDNL